MTRVLLLSTGIPDPTQGGSGIFNYFVTRELLLRGYETDALFRVSADFLRNHSVSGPLKELQSMGLNATLIPQHKGPSRFDLGSRYLCLSHGVPSSRMALQLRGGVGAYDGCISFDFGWAVALGNPGIRSIRLLADPLSERVRWQPRNGTSPLESIARFVRVATIARAYISLTHAVADTPGVTLGSFSPREVAHMGAMGVPVRRFRWFAPGPREVRRPRNPRDRLVLLHVGDLATTASRRMIAFSRDELFSSFASLPFEIELRLVGRYGTSLALPSAPPNVSIVLTSHLESLDEEFANAHAFLSLVPYPVGVRTRILTALAHGIPVIADASAAGGLPELRAGIDLIYTRTPADVGDALRRVRDDPEAFEEMGASGRFAWERSYRPEDNAPRLVDALMRGTSGVPNG